MASSRSWFALALAGVLGLFYLGHGLHERAEWRLPASNTVIAQETARGRELSFNPTNHSSSSEGSKIAKIPGGWLVERYEVMGLGQDSLTLGLGLAFVPDPEHKWDGHSLK